MRYWPRPRPDRGGCAAAALPGAAHCPGPPPRPQDCCAPLTRPPAAGLDPGDPCGPSRAATRGQAQACPGPRAAPPGRDYRYPHSSAGKTRNRPRCDDPLNPSWKVVKIFESRPSAGAGETDAASVTRTERMPRVLGHHRRPAITGDRASRGTGHHEGPAITGDRPSRGTGHHRGPDRSGRAGRQGRRSGTPPGPLRTASMASWCWAIASVDWLITGTGCGEAGRCSSRPQPGPVSVGSPSRLGKARAGRRCGGRYCPAW